MSKRRKRALWAKYMVRLTGCILVGMVLFGACGAEQKQYWDSDWYVVAHRAGAAHGPENTLLALEMAIADGAEIAEIDIQQMKDGTLIVMHDESFARTCGNGLKVWNAVLADAMELDAGRYYPGNGMPEPVPTLEQMLIAARGRIRLMIEIKINGYENGLEQVLLKLLDEYDMERQSIVGSMDLGILRKIKVIAPEIETVYITHSLKASEFELDYIDSYSVKHQNLTAVIIDRIHEEGKLVYGWTVNSRKYMRRLARLGVDGLITDDVRLAVPY